MSIAIEGYGFILTGSFYSKKVSTSTESCLQTSCIDLLALSCLPTKMYKSPFRNMKRGVNFLEQCFINSLIISMDSSYFPLIIHVITRLYKISAAVRSLESKLVDSNICTKSFLAFLQFYRYSHMTPRYIDRYVAVKISPVEFCPTNFFKDEIVFDPRAAFFSSIDSSKNFTISWNDARPSLSTEGVRSLGNFVVSSSRSFAEPSMSSTSSLHLMI